MAKLERRSHAASEIEDYSVYKSELRNLKRGVSAKANMLASLTGFLGIFLGCAISFINSDFSCFSLKLFLNAVVGTVAFVLTIFSWLAWRNCKDNLKEIFEEIEARPLDATGEKGQEVSSSALEELPSEPKPKDAG